MMIPKSLEALVEELSKTEVISPKFKDLIVRLASDAIAEALAGGAKPETLSREQLREEFINRPFSDKAVVRLKARTMSDLLNREDLARISVGIARMLATDFPRGEGMKLLLMGSAEEVEAVREWLLREISTKPENASRFI